MKKITAIIAIIGIFALQAYSQKKAEIDSLITVSDTISIDSLKAKIFGRLHELIMFSDPELAREYAIKGLNISRSINYQRGIAVGYMQIGNYFFNRAENDSASYYYQKALRKFEEINSVRGQIFAIHTLADIERIRGNYDSAIALVNKNIMLYENRDTTTSDLGQFNLIGAEYQVLGAIYMDKGRYLLAMRETLKSANFFNKIKDRIREADALKQLGNIEYAQGNYQSSLNYCVEAYRIYGEYNDKVYQAYAANSAGLAAAEMQDYETGEKYQSIAIALSRETGLKSALSAALKDMGRIHIARNELTEAKKKLLEALGLARETDEKLDIVSALTELAVLDISYNKPSEAIIKLNEAIQISEPIGANAHLSTAYKLRSRAGEMLNNKTDALEDFKKFHALHDSIYNAKKSSQIEELKTIYETEKKEVELALRDIEIQALNQQVKISSLQKELFAGGMFTIAAVSILIVFGFRQRMKRNRIEREKEEEILRKEIEYKKKELATQTLHLVQKNTFIQELKENLERIKNSPELFKIEYRRIVMLLHRENASDKDWEVFKSYFSEVHDNFDKKLMAINPDITEKELRMASFIKMKLSTKEIASMLNVLPDSVQKSKYRLKKKLNIGQDTDLYQHLNAL